MNMRRTGYMSALTTHNDEQFQLDGALCSGPRGEGLLMVSAVVEEYMNSERKVLQGVLNEFGERGERHDEVMAKFEAGMREELEEFLQKAEKPLNQLTFDDVREFLRKRYELTGDRSVTLDMIDKIRKDGIGERLDEQFRSAESELRKEKEGSSEERKTEIDKVMEEISKEFENEKRSLHKTDLAKELEFEEYSRSLISFSRGIDDKVNALISNES